MTPTGHPNCHCTSEESYTTFLKMSAQEKPSAFYRCRVSKEAYLKVIGTGLHFSLNQVKVNFSNSEKPKLLYVEVQPLEPDLW